MKVWLDDERSAPPGWTRARTVDDVIALLIAEEPFGGVEELSLDHDLGSRRSTVLWKERCRVTEPRFTGSGTNVYVRWEKGQRYWLYRSAVPFDLANEEVQELRRRKDVAWAYCTEPKEVALGLVQAPVNAGAVAIGNDADARAT